MKNWRLLNQFREAKSRLVDSLNIPGPYMTNFIPFSKVRKIHPLMIDLEASAETPKKVLKVNDHQKLKSAQITESGETGSFFWLNIFCKMQSGCYIKAQLSSKIKEKHLRSQVPNSFKVSAIQCKFLHISHRRDWMTPNILKQSLRLDWYCTTIKSGDQAHSLTAEVMVFTRVKRLGWVWLDTIIATMRVLLPNDLRCGVGTPFFTFLSY